MVEQLIPIAIHFENVAVSGLKDEQIMELKLILDHMQEQLIQL